MCSDGGVAGSLPVRWLLLIFPVVVFVFSCSLLCVRVDVLSRYLAMCWLLSCFVRCDVRGQSLVVPCLSLVLVLSLVCWCGSAPSLPRLGVAVGMRVLAALALRRLGILTLIFDHVECVNGQILETTPERLPPLPCPSSWME